MKKFFKDVIGEIKNPSEDADKVLDVIKRVILTIIFVIFFFKITNIVSAIYFTVIPYIQNGVLTDMTNPAGYIADWTFEVVRLLSYGILFFTCRRIVKKNQKANKSLFLAIFVILTLMYIVENVFLFENSSLSLLSLVSITCRYIFIYIAFFPVSVNKNNEKNNHIELEQTQVRNIAIFGYIFTTIFTLGLGLHAVQLIISQLYILENAISADIIDRWIWINLLYAFFVLFQTIIFVIIFARCLLSRKVNENSEKSNVPILGMALIISLMSIFFIGALNIDVLYIVVFCLAVSYQNKYKVFDNLGTRIFKNTIQKIKTGFNNYLSFKE